MFGVPKEEKDTTVDTMDQRDRKVDITQTTMITPAIQVLIVRQCGAMEFNSITAVQIRYILIKSAIQVLTGTYTYNVYYVVFPALMKILTERISFEFIVYFLTTNSYLFFSFSLSLSLSLSFFAATVLIVVLHPNQTATKSATKLNTAVKEERDRKEGTMEDSITEVKEERDRKEDIMDQKKNVKLSVKMIIHPIIHQFVHQHHPDQTVTKFATK
jgi:hypothetical protein